MAIIITKNTSNAASGDSGDGTGGGGIYDPIEFVVDGPGDNDPPSEQNMYYNDEIQIGRKFLFFVEGQLQFSNTYQIQAGAIALTDGTNFQPDERCTLIRY